MGKDASAMLTVTPADTSNDASAVLARIPVQHQQGHQLCDKDVLQHCNWADASATWAMMPVQGQRCQRKPGGGTSTREKTPAQQGGQRQRNNGDNASAMLARAPTQRWQRCQLCNDNVLRAALQVCRSQQY
jgi:hypothetical protein